MKSLNIQKLGLNLSDLSQVPSQLDAANVAFNAIDTVNWAEFPYKPTAEFRMVATPEGLVINYRVKEGSVAAVAPADCGNVWEDACVEFFSSPADDGYYYNVECNCAGTILIAVGKDRHVRERAPKEVLEAVKRWSSLGREPFAERVGECEWQVVLLIPYGTYFKHDFKTLDGMTIRANFYKCGDKLQTPHFLSWNPIEVKEPDFHRPEWFGELNF